MKFTAKRCREEEEELLVYRNVTVYVRRLTGSERLPEKDMSDPDYEYLNGIGNNCQNYEVLISSFYIKNFVCVDFRWAWKEKWVKQRSLSFQQFRFCQKEQSKAKSPWRKRIFRQFRHATQRFQSEGEFYVYGLLNSILKWCESDKIFK